MLRPAIQTQFERMRGGERIDLVTDLVSVRENSPRAHRNDQQVGREGQIDLVHHGLDGCRRRHARAERMHRDHRTGQRLAVWPA